MSEHALMLVVLLCASHHLHASGVRQQLDPGLQGNSRSAQGRNLEVAGHQTENKALEILHDANTRYVRRHARDCSLI